MEESPAFVEFLEFLGKKIELHDFKGFGHFLVKFQLKTILKSCVNFHISTSLKICKKQAFTL